MWVGELSIGNNALRTKNWWISVMVNTYKSDAFESIHSSAAALLEIGAIDKAAKSEFDASCIADLPAEIKPDQIK